VIARPRPDIYRGKDPKDLPLYWLTEAAHYLRLPLATVRSWVVGRDYPTEKGKRVSPAVIPIADPNDRLLSFHNLVELHVLSSIRRTHAVQLKAVRAAVKYLRDRLDSKHPLLDHQMLTDGKDLFMEKYGHYLNLTSQGQIEMKQALEVYLNRIERDQEGVPIRLFPFTRKVEAQAGALGDWPRSVAIDPGIRFGKPCITGTRIPTAMIAERYAAGDSVALLADDYERSPGEIEEAIRYEIRLAS
jgi:uncharacterized protein (DUF433 family)